MSNLFYDAFEGANGAGIEARAPELGGSWTVASGSDAILTDGAGQAFGHLDVPTSIRFGDEYVDIPIPAGTSRLDIAVRQSMNTHGSLAITAMRLTAPGTLGTGQGYISAAIGSSGGHKTFDTTVACSQAGTGTNTTANLPVGSSDAYVEAERRWQLTIIAGGGTKLSIDGTVVNSVANEGLASSGGFFTDYGLRLDITMLSYGTTTGQKLNDAVVWANNSEDPPPPPGPADAFWTDLVNTHEAA